MTSSRKGNVLIVDDDADIRAVICDGLEDAGYSCDQASDGPTALEMVGQNDYDIVFMDLLMPGLPGREAVVTIKERRPHTVIVVVSIVCDEDAMRELFDSGAMVYIRKPFSIEEIVRTADNLLGDRVKAL